ncbi:MAG: polysaccharide biosynthesis/export family protein [Candidatus Acidiferrales bacterium]
MSRSLHRGSSTCSAIPIFSSLLILACFFSCSMPAYARQNAAAKNAGERDVVSKTAFPSEDSAELAHRDNRYRLCASDVIAISFPLTPEFDQTVTIQPDGFATLTAAGDVRLEGLTTQESIRAIRAAYSKTLNGPIVTVELKKFNEPYFIVSGQVRQPGKYDLHGYVTATEAVAMAGGFNQDAKHSQVLLFRRVNENWFEVKNLNLKRILQGRDLAEDSKIQSGDMLFVPQNEISKIKRLVPAYGVGTYYQLYH